MFYSHTTLARKSPLGTVWIAAHFEKRLKKPQIEKANIASYAELIMFPDAPIALRLSGQLLYGLVRIYELKVNYAYKDCQKLETDINSTIKSLKLNLPPDADRFQIDAITLPNTFQLDATDLHDSDFNLDETDRHQRTFDQIILTDEFQETYVSVHFEEFDRSNYSNQHAFSNQGFGPMDEDTLPPFGGEMEERISPSKIPAQNPSNLTENSNLNLNMENTPPQIEIEISNSNLNQLETNPERTPPQNQTDTEISNANPNFSQENSGSEIRLAEGSSARNNNDNSSINIAKSLKSRNESLSPIQPLQNENILEPNLNARNNSLSPLNNALPLSSPQNVELQVRAPSPVRNKRRRRGPNELIFDIIPVLSNEEMKKQLDDTSKLVSKRRKLAACSVDIYRLGLHRLKDQVFSKLLLNGECKTFINTMERIIPITNDSSVGPAEKMTWQAENATPQNPNNETLNEKPSTENLRFASTPQNASNETLNGNSASPFVQNEAPFLPPNVDSDKSGGAETEILPKSVGITWQSKSATPGAEMQVVLDPVQEVNEGVLHLPPSPVNNNIYSDNNDNNNINNDDDGINNDNVSNNNNSGNSGVLNFLQTPESVKAKRARISEESEKRGESLSFVDIERTEENCWSARSMDVAQFLRKITPSSEINSQQINLNKILENRSRKESARMFFETLVLTSCDYIGVKQEKPYGDILITPKPKLSDATRG